MRAEYIIKSQNDFEKIRILENYKDKSIIIFLDIVNNIKFDESYMPVDLKDYTVVLKGNNNTFSNLNVVDKINLDGRRDYVGLFARAKNLYVSNLNVKDSTLYGESMCGILAGQVDDFLSVDNCNFGNINIICSSHSGTLVGTANRAIIKNTNVYSKLHGVDVLGGIVGLVNEYNDSNTNVICSIKSLGKCIGNNFGYSEKNMVRILRKNDVY